MTQNVSNAKMERELRVIFSAPDFDVAGETTKSIRHKLCQALGLDEFPSEKKAVLMELMKRLVNEKQDDDDEEEEEKKEEEDEDDEDDEVSDDEASPKKRKTSPKTNEPNKKKQKKAAPKSNNTNSSSTTATYNSQVKILLELGTAMRLGPRLYKGLKEMDSDQERITCLTERLQEAGASWKGQLPSKHDIQSAKQERQRLDDLDGIDTSLILDDNDNAGSRRRGRRGRGTTAVSYVEKDVVDEEDEEEEKVKATNEEAEAEEKKPPKKNNTPASDGDGNDDDGNDIDDDDDDDDFDGPSSDEEEEFEWLHLILSSFFQINVGRFWV